MLNLSQMIKCMQFPASACLLPLCAYYDQHGLAFYFVAGKIGDMLPAFRKVMEWRTLDACE
jgi:hypothetical protein